MKLLTMIFCTLWLLPQSGSAQSDRNAAAEAIADAVASVQENRSWEAQIDALRKIATTLDQTNGMSLSEADRVFADRLASQGEATILIETAYRTLKDKRPDQMEAVDLGVMASALMSSAVDAEDAGLLTASAAVYIADSLTSIDDRLKSAGHAGLGAAVSEASGDALNGAALMKNLSRFKEAAKAVAIAGKLSEASAQETKEFVDGFLKMLPPGANIILANPATFMARDQLAQTHKTYNLATEGLSLVADAIETGRFDFDRYNGVIDGLKALRKSPWDKSTALRYAKQICESLPLMKPWCDDLIGAFEAKAPTGACAEIDCNCSSFGRIIQVDCLMAEDTLRRNCRVEEAVAASCFVPSDGAE